MGPLVSEEHYNKVTSYLDIAKEENSTLVCGGKRPEFPENLKDGYYLEPTVYVHDDPTHGFARKKFLDPLLR